MITFNQSFTCFALDSTIDAVKLNVKFFLTLESSTCLLAVLGNTAFVVVMLKSKALHSPSNVLLGAISTKDMFCSYVIQPLYMAFCSFISFKSTTKHRIWRAVNISLGYYHGLTFTYIIILTIDRYFAICQPRAYRENASCKTHFAVSLLCAVVWSLAILVNPYQHPFQVVHAMAWLFVLVVAVYTGVEITKEIIFQKRFGRIE